VRLMTIQPFHIILTCFGLVTTWAIVEAIVK
jgi:hypothetical protein